MDGTHFSRISMRLARKGAHVTIRHFIAIDEGALRLSAIWLTAGMNADCQMPDLAYG
jgi:hypothetical protein